MITATIFALMGILYTYFYTKKTVDPDQLASVEAI